MGGLPLVQAGEVARAAFAVQGEQVGRDAFEQIAVVGDEDEGTGEREQAVFQHFQGRDVQVVGRLVENEHVGRLEHELGDQDAGLLAAG